jgi:hypoxanthine phosphoribosyltransferase
MSEKIPCELVFWQDIQALARELAFMIRGSGFRPDIILAIGRGGYIPGRLLSDYLNILNLTGFKVEHYKGTDKAPTARVRYPLSAEVDGLRVLVVDDVTDTGDSFDVALEHVRSRGGSPEELRTAVLHHKSISPFVPDYYAAQIEDWRWVIYPWAMVEDLTALIGKMVDPPSGAEAIARRLLADNGIQVPLGVVRDVLELMR